MLKKMEPCLMSACEPRILALTGDDGMAEAKLFRGGRGKRMVSLCTGGPGKAAVQFRLDGSFHSEYGHCAAQGPVWRFTAGDIAADILFER